jgi:hypothetical protein
VKWTIRKDLGFLLAWGRLVFLARTRHTYFLKNNNYGVIGGKTCFPPVCGANEFSGGGITSFKTRKSNVLHLIESSQCKQKGIPFFFSPLYY